MDGRSHCPPPLSVYPTFQENINKSYKKKEKNLLISLTQRHHSGAEMQSIHSYITIFFRAFGQLSRFVHNYGSSRNYTSFNCVNYYFQVSKYSNHKLELDILM